MTEGLDMGCVLSPVLAQFYISEKMRGWKEDLVHVQDFVFYIDDCGIRFDGDVIPERVVKYYVEKKLLPLEMVWEDNSGILDVIWERDVSIQSTWFDDRGRVFGLDLEAELPASVKASCVVQQLERIAERDGYTYGFTDLDPPIVTYESLRESRMTWVWYQHRAQTEVGEVESEENMEDFDLFGPPSESREDVYFTRRLQSKRGVRYLPGIRHTESQDCPGCKWGMRWADSTKRPKKWTEIECLWTPLWETRLGRKAVKRVMLETHVNVSGDPVSIRWKCMTVKALNVGMLKEVRLNTWQNVTDESRGGDEKASG
jgi:hypothetical protein